MSLSGPTPPTVQSPDVTASTQQGINTQTAGQQQGINTQTAGQQQGINAQTASLQDIYNQLTAGRQYAYNTDTANAQEKLNVGNATASQAGSMVNQNNPFGTLGYQQYGTGPGGVPLYTSTVGLNPQLQGIVNSLMGQSGASLAGANYGSGNPSDIIGGMSSGTTQGLLDKFSSYTDPYNQTANDRLDTQLKNQGFKPGDIGYDNAMNSQKLSQGQVRNAFITQALPEAYKEATSNYLMPLTTSSQEMGLLGQVPGMVSGSFVNAPGLNISNPTMAGTSVANTGVGGTTVAPTTLPPVDYTGAVKDYNSANMAAYNAQVAANGNMMSGLFGIPSALLGGWAKGGFPGASSLGSMFGGAGAAGGAEAAGMGSAAASADLLASLGSMAMI